MRVALFTDTYLPDVNGVARTLGRWVDFLRSRRIPHIIFSPNGEWISEEPSPTANVYDPVKTFLNIPFLLYRECRIGMPNPRYIRKKLDAFQPTLIHVSTPFNMGLCGMHYAKKTNTPLIASYHTHFDQYLQHYHLQWLDSLLWKYLNWFHRDCRKIFVPSQSTLAYLESKGFQHLEIWGRGIDTTFYRPRYSSRETLEHFALDPERFTFLFVGRLAPEKNLILLLEAYQSMPPSIRSQCQLVIVGAGPQSKELHQAYAGQDDIRFLGFVEGEELAQLYAAADVFAFPSATETFGNVVLEAMASGTPVIGMDAGGVKDNIQHERTGLLCPKDDTQAFQQAMIRLFENKLERNKLTYYGLQYSRQQSWQAIFEQLLASYQAVIEDSEALILPSEAVIS